VKALSVATVALMIRFISHETSFLEGQNLLEWYSRAFVKCRR